MVNDSDDIINDETLFTGIYEFLLREVPFPESNLLLPKESLVSFGFEYTHQWVVSVYEGQESGDDSYFNRCKKLNDEGRGIRWLSINQRHTPTHNVFCVLYCALQLCWPVVPPVRVQRAWRRR